ncbi:MAG TPA: glycosyltransferase [Pseudonocardiaceae bacterium]|nr:glycosyltransferase [Pseudonocardiaceae bacterium]
MTRTTGASADSMTTVSVVICAYTEKRWADLLAAIESAHDQEHRPTEILVVIDHNPALAARLTAHLAEHPAGALAPVEVRVLENYGARGLSGARNTALAECVSEIVAFLDDDACARPGWLDRLLTHYADERVVGVGGAATPAWPTGRRPVTLPVSGGRAQPVRGELDWVVGCTYTGQPRKAAEVRNLMGCNMSFRREVFLRVGGFTESIGRVGAVPLGCEETELCIRIRRADPTARIVFEPTSLVYHKVSPDRLTWSYLRRRSYAEGVSKAAVSTMVGAEHALSTERAYTSRIIPVAVLRELGRAVRGQRDGLLGAGALVLSVLFAALGYLRGSLSAQKVVNSPKSADLLPIALGEFDLSVARSDLKRAVRLLPVRVPTRPMVAKVLIRDGDHVLGEVEVPVHEGIVDPAALRAAVDELPTRPEDLHPMREQPLVSVVIASASRPHTVLRCARSVLTSTYPQLEVLIVDNRPNTPNSQILRDFVATDNRLRYVPEPHIGASNARNRGAAEAFGEIIAFTDDDAVVDRHWLAALVAEFADPAVDCVTGLVLPLSLDTPAQQWFENWGGFSKGYHRRRLTSAGVTGPADPNSAGRMALYPFAAGMFGSGNNMAWRAGSYRALGGCDPLLGPGSPTASGEDLELFIRLVRGDGVLIYTPNAVVRHEHRRETKELARQMHSYGTGLFPMFAVYIGRRPWELLPVIRRLPRGIRHMLAGDSERNTGRGHDYPAELARAEVRGMIAGPVQLLLSLLVSPRRRLGLPEPEATVALRAIEPSMPTLSVLRGGQ